MTQHDRSRQEGLRQAQRVELMMCSGAQALQELQDAIGQGGGEDTLEVEALALQR